MGHRSIPQNVDASNDNRAQPWVENLYVPALGTRAVRYRSAAALTADCHLFAVAGSCAIRARLFLKASASRSNGVTFPAAVVLWIKSKITGSPVGENVGLPSLRSAWLRPSR